MLRKTKITIISMISLFAMGVGGALAYFGFGDSAFRSIHSGADVDNIHENYNIGKVNPIPEYDMYVFPSSYYLSQANASNKPEDIYGYIDIPIDATGINTDRAKFVPNPTNRFLSADEATKQYCIDIDNFPNESVGYDDWGTSNDIPKNIQTYMGENPIDQGNAADTSDYDSRRLKFEGGVNVGKKRHVRDGILGEVSFTDVTANDNTSYNDVGNIEEDNLDSDLGPNVDPNVNFSEKARPYYQKLNIDDRLGYWYELNSDKGRYLPIKLSFTGSISPETFIKLVPNPRADMSDKNGWHNYKFANWVYYNLTGQKPYTKPNEAFTNFDKSNIFDILSNLEAFSVYDDSVGKNIIRLFPTFTNGKDYPSSLGNNIVDMNDVDRGKGYRDGIRVDYTTLTNDRKDYQTRYFTFEGKEQNTAVTFKDNNNNDKTANFNYAVLNDFNVDEKTLKYIDFNGVFTDVNGRTLYYSEWSNSQNAINENWGVSYFTDENIKLFEAGDKNIYAFGTANFYSNQNDALEAIKGLVKKMAYTSSGQTIYTGILGETVGRFLVPITNTTNLNEPTYMILKSPNRSLYHAYALFFERIIEFKNIQNSPIDNTKVDTVDGIDVYQETRDNILVEHYRANYDSSPAFYLETEKYYEGKVVEDKGISFIPTSSKPKNEASRFVYKADMIDCTNISTEFFGIRMANSDLNLQPYFNLHPLEGENTHIYHTDETLTEGISYNIPSDYYGTYENADKYIEHVKFRAISPDGTIQDYNGFKFKSNSELDPKGVYSVVMHFNPSSTSGYNFDMYVYKARDLFVKVFNKKMSLVQNDPTEELNGFLDHYNKDEYYEKRYMSGEKIKPNDVFVKNAVTKTIEDIFTEYCDDRVKEVNKVGEAYDHYHDPQGIYYLTDTVSRAFLMRYDANKPIGERVTFSQENDLTILKNYVLTVISHDAYRNDKTNPLPELNEPAYYK